MTPNIIGAVLGGVTKIADDLITTPEEQAKIDIQNRELDIREAEAQQRGDIGQIDVNKAEAANPSLFVSGWRPAVGWACVSACVWNWIGLPVTKMFLGLAGITVDLAPAPMDEMMPVLLGMLGLGAMRTFEKVKSVARH